MIGRRLGERARDDRPGEPPPPPVRQGRDVLDLGDVIMRVKAAVGGHLAPDEPREAALAEKTVERYIGLHELARGIAVAAVQLCPQKALDGGLQGLAVDLGRLVAHRHGSLAEAASVHHHAQPALRPAARGQLRREPHGDRLVLEYELAMEQAGRPLKLFGLLCERRRIGLRGPPLDEDEVPVPDVGEIIMEVRRAEWEPSCERRGARVGASHEAEHALKLFCASVGRHPKVVGYRLITLRKTTGSCDLPDRTILITGGTGALGSAVVEAFLGAGWRVVVTWVEPSELERVPAREGLALVEADLFDEAAVGRAVAEAAGEPSAPLRAVANLVGGYAGGSRVHETALEEFERQFRLNLRPTFLVTRAAIPHMLEAGGGSLVCVSTRAALEPFSGAAGYIASKAAVLAFVRAIAVEYRDDGVRCNAILPSVIDTPANRASQPDADHSRWVKPAEIARVVLFLGSDDSSPTSGAAIPVYGRA